MDKLGLGFVLILSGCTAGPPAASPAHEAASSAPKVAATSSSAPEATAAPGSAARAIVAGASPDYDEVCNGSIDEAVQRELSARAARARFCYERLLKRDPQREGRLVVSVKLSESGNIDQATVAQDELADAETSDCVLAAFRDPLKRGVNGNCANVNIPLRFQRKPPEPPADAAAPPPTP